MRLEFCLPLALLFLTNGAPSNAQNAAEERLVSVAAGEPLTVECALRVEQRAEWRRDGGAVPRDLRPAGERPAAGGLLAARLHAPAARPAHAGLYTCSRRAGAQRVRVAVGPAQYPTGEVAADDAAPPPAAAAAAADDDSVLEYDVKGLLQLNCTATGAPPAEYKWTKNGTDVSAVAELNSPSARYRLAEGGAVFRIEHAHEDDYGNYSCGARRWDVRGRPVVRLPADSNVVEGQKIRIQCRVVGKPYPRVSWHYANGSGAEPAPVAEDARVRLEDSEAGVPGGALLLAEARREDAGRYECRPPAGAAHAASTTLRVKDMYAALWPFLGICAEVFVLCAIILVYEKRRTKPELDDSDADNHDQKKS